VTTASTSTQATVSEPASSAVAAPAAAPTVQSTSVQSASQTAPASSYTAPAQAGISLGLALRRPAAPTDATPTDTALTRTAFDASWSTDPNATSYDVYLGVTPEPQLFVSGLTTSVVHIQGLAPNTTYYWRVVARNAAGETLSGTWTFTTRDR
jgi:hypothetical protein